LIVDEGSLPHDYLSWHIVRPNITGYIFVLRIPDADTYFVKYLGISALSLNGLNLRSRKAYVFPTGSTIRGSKMKPILYSEVESKFLFTSENDQHSSVAAIEAANQESFFSRVKTKFIKAKNRFVN